jgi:hypothetical protein
MVNVCYMFIIHRYYAKCFTRVVIFNIHNFVRQVAVIISMQISKLCLIPNRMGRRFLFYEQFWVFDL